MSLFGGSDLSTAPGVRLTAGSNSNGDLRKTVGATTVAVLNKNSINPTNGKPKLDPSDPRVQKLVYSMYRNMLTAYNEEANDFVSQKDPDIVKQDLGVGPILQTIIIRQGSQQGSSTPAPSIESSDNSTTIPSTVSAAPIATGGMPPPPPPPPLIPSGAIPAVRLNSEIGPRDKGPPMALANAMMKDKKPFTYTPGGIDLSEIRSPRMAKRIQMNAAAEGVTSAPESRPTPAPPPGGPPGYLPPAALAAMQPQMAIPVFPQGGFNPGNLNKTHKPADFIPPPPPGPPPFMQQLQQNFTNQNRQQSPPPARTPPPPPVRSSTPTTVPVQFESRPVSNNRATDNGFSDNVDNRVSPVPPVGVGTGCIYIPPVETQKSKPASPTPAPAQKTIQTKAQAHSQNLGSIYIPPIEQKGNERNPGTAGSNSSAESPSVRSVASPPQSQPPTPMTPLLNKAPTPWMNSYNRMQNQPPSTPPYVNPANIMTPWGTAGAVRTIPISMADDDNSNANSSNIGGVRSVSGPSPNNTRVIPIQIQRNDVQPQQQQYQQQQPQHYQQQQQQPVARNIPIQMEGGNRRPAQKGNQTPSTPGTPQPGPGYQKRIVPAAYNNPMGLYSNQNAAEAYHKQAGEIYGMDSVSIDDANRRTEPIQSKSLRVIQKVAEDELLRFETQQQESLRRFELMGEDKQLMDLFKAQVDEGSSLHQSEEPRFRGGHIPSRAFRALQSNLPSPGVYEQAPNYPTQAQNAKGQLTHNIQILMQSQPQSPTPQQQQGYQHHMQLQPDSFGAGGPKVPPSQQKIPEPKKYMGSNIPSRSFKILQAMTAEDDSTASESEAAPEDQNSYSSDENSETNPYPFPYPYAFPNDQDPNSEQGQGNEYAQQQWPENFEGDPNWDPYTYMSWYYWWYYTSCYWNGYDMSGFEYPANWDPNYFPEGYSSDYSGYETCPEAYNQSQMESIPSKSFKNLQRSYENEDIPTGPDVPKIVIESETSSSLEREAETENTYLMKPDSSNVKLNDCDRKKNVVSQRNDLEGDSSSDDDNEEDYESCVEEQMVIKSETGSECNRGTENKQKDIVENEDDEEDEETEPEDDDGDEGIVEEPETPSSEDSDAATLVDEVCYDRYSRVGNITIEEYQSPTSDSCDSFFDLGKKNRLSTIDELTENERSRASSVMPINSCQELEFDREPLREELEEDEEDNYSDSDSEDLSSVSVIENKSDAQGETTTATESKREDGTTSSEDGDGDVEDDGEENDMAAVTVRLPLKLSFTKSKSYRDIATVLVCDSEVCSGEEANEDVRTGQIMQVKETTQEFNDVHGNEPAVSFTISLSRSTSKNKDEDVVKNVDITDTVEMVDATEKASNDVEESADIDFWSQIGSSEVEKSQDFWETKKTSEEKSNNFSTSNPVTVDEPVQDFWGALSKEKTKLAESTKDIDFWGTSDQTDDDAQPPAHEESKTEEVLDFWGEITGSKSEEIVTHKPMPGPNETKKSVSWDRKDSINYKWDNEFNFWDKSGKSVEARRFSHNFEISEAYESDSGLKTENKRKKVDRLHHKRHSIHGSIWDTLKNKEQGEIKKETETESWQSECKNTESPWSNWDNLDKEKSQNENQNGRDVDSDSSSEDEDDNNYIGNSNTSAEINLVQNESESESEEEEPEEMETPEDEMKKCIEATRKSISAVEYPNVSNASVCHSETEGVSSRLSPALPISDENSDESSSKSSATTIGRDKSDSEKGDVTEKAGAPTIPNGRELKVTGDNGSDSIRKPGGPTAKETEPSRRQIERPIEIRELREKIKLSPSKDLDGHQDESCTCHLADRMARAEGLLWRIERFLQESLSLGSEDDSGVMTDLSRQISDVDTDADNDINDNEFLLTAAFAAKQKRSSGSRNNGNNSATNTNTHQPNCTHNQTETQVKKRPTSEILLESHSKTETEIETDSVKMRSASERKALRYQRAKTHSRLFQLLQVECSKEDDDDDDDFDGDSAPENPGNEKNIPIETEEAVTKEATAPSTTSTEERRSRLVPLPIKNFLTSSLSCDSNSSPSGSSGVLSPTSPVNRDQLLADIINEFHLRHQQQNQKRLSNFPSKIFKLLQQEFGEEFYQTFDCCTDDSGFQIPVSVEGDKHCQGGSLVQECTIHKSESLKLLEEAAALRSSGSPSLNSKDKSANHCRKSNATAKNKNTTSSNHRTTTTATAIATESTEILTVTSGTATTKDSKFLEVPLRRKKSNVNRDPRSPRTKKS